MWNAAAVNLLPLFNPNNPNMVLKSQVTVSQYQVDKVNGWFIPSTYGPNVSSGVAESDRDFDGWRNLEWVTQLLYTHQDHQIKYNGDYKLQLWGKFGHGASLGLLFRRIDVQ